MNTQKVRYIDGQKASEMDASAIKAALERRGWSLRRLSVAHDYSPNAVARALHRPYPKAERIIASALGLHPWEIWPERYPNGPVPMPDSVMANLNTGDKK